MERHPLRAERKMGFGDGNEVTEPVEVPRSDFEKRDGNMASKDIAESPTRSGTPKKETQNFRISELQNLRKL